MSDSVAKVNDEVQDAISDIYNFVDDTVRVCPLLFCHLSVHVGIAVLLTGAGGRCL